MDRITGRPNHIEDALIRIHTNQWFTWTDSKNKVYANLQLTEKIGVDGVLIDNAHSKPTEKECTDKLKELQDAWDLEKAEYKENRRKAYERIPDQLDQLYHDIDNDKLGADAKTGTWYLAVKSVKDANPKS